MKATIKETGKTYPVFQIILNRLVCLSIDGRKVDYGVSEVKLLPDASLGQEISWRFVQQGETLRYDTDLKRVARRAAKTLKMTITDCEKALHRYLYP